MREKVISTIDLFPEINTQLITLLQSLSVEDWHKDTVLPGRTVKDIASHLLDGSLRNLSIQRDGHNAIKNNISSFEDLVAFIQKMNKDWIEVSKRLSPQILTALLEIAENWFYEFKKTLDPHGKAIFAVAWAGETESKNWFDIAREYTERWHHQMQIRLAVNKPKINSGINSGINSEITSRRLFFPVIDTFMLGLPYAYRSATIKNKGGGGGGVKIEVTGQAHGTWYLENQNSHSTNSTNYTNYTNCTKWRLVEELSSDPETIIKLSGDIAWQLFSDSMSKQEAEKHIEISGNKKLAEPLLHMKSVMRFLKK